MTLTELDLWGPPEWLERFVSGSKPHPADLWRRGFRELGHLAFQRSRTSAAGVGFGLLLHSYVEYSPNSAKLGTAFVSQARLARELGMTPQTAGPLALEGVAAGWWIREKRKGTSPLWTLAVPAVEPFRSTEGTSSVQRNAGGRFQRKGGGGSTEATSHIPENLPDGPPSGPEPDEPVPVLVGGHRTMVDPRTAHKRGLEVVQ